MAVSPISILGMLGWLALDLDLVLGPWTALD